jgi:hypothetical protein
MLAVGLLVVILVIVIYYYWTKGNNNLRFAEGVWSSDKEFNNEAEITSFDMVIKRDQKTGNWRAFVLVINDDGDVVESKASNILINNNSIFQNPNYMKFSIPDSSILPKETTMELNIMRGSLTLKGNKKGKETIYAELFKDNKLTDFNASEAKLVNNQPPVEEPDADLGELNEGVAI